MSVPSSDRHAASCIASRQSFRYAQKPTRRQSGARAVKEGISEHGKLKSRGVALPWRVDEKKQPIRKGLSR